jgi:periplasmic copper chaperone A
MLYRFRNIMLIAAALVAFFGVLPAAAHDITVRQAWSRATPKGAKVAGGYLTIENRGVRPDRLLSASSAAAAKIEIHQMSMQNGIMTMRPLDDGLAIPPDATVTLAPGGDHIMFVGLIAPFEEGQHVAVSLNFERAGKVEASFEVGSVGAKGPRLQIASTEPAAAAASPARAAVTDEPFFTHICGTRVMANITVSPGRSGPIEVLVQIEDGDEKPLAVDALSVTLSNPDKGIAPVTMKAALRSKTPARPCGRLDGRELQCSASRSTQTPSPTFPHCSDAAATPSSATSADCRRRLRRSIGNWPAESDAVVHYLSSNSLRS